MEDLDIIYEFEDISKVDKKKTEEEDEQKYHFVYSLSTEEACKLTREKIEQFLKYDDVDIPKDTTIKYILLEEGETKEQKDFKELKEPYEELETYSKYELNLKLGIDMNAYLEEMKNKESEREKKEEEEIQKQNKDAEELLKELSSIRKEIKNAEINKKREKIINSQLNHSTMIFEVKNKHNLDKENEKLNPKSLKNFYTKQKLNNSTYIKKSNKEEKNKMKNKIYFFYSLPKEDCNEDYSFYEQWLYIYKKIESGKKVNKEIDKPEIYLRQINTNLSLEENIIILHIRVDTVEESNEVFFYYCDNEFYSYKYKLEDLFKENKEEKTENVFKDLKLLIISSNNIDLIKSQIDKIENLKNTIKIYINHPKELKEQNFEFYNEENEIIKIFYDILLSSNNIKEAISAIQKNDKYKLFQITCNNDNLIIFEKKGNNKIEHNNFNEKNLLKYDILLDGYYPLIGRKKEFFRCLEKQSKKVSMCICGNDEEELKYFLKKIGFSFYERMSPCKVYFLEIYENERINKIDLLFDEICQKNYEGIIYLIIFFNGIKNSQEIKNEIKRERIPEEGNIIINYIYAFADKQIDENEICDIKLDNFIEYDEYEIKSLINYYTKNQKIDFKLMDDIFKNIKVGGPKIIIKNLNLLLIYMNLFTPKEITNNDYNILLNYNDNNNEIEKVKKIFLEKIKNLNPKIKDIFCYLYILKYGISSGFFENLLFSLEKKDLKYIMNKLIGLLIIENNENEKIYRLNSSFRNIIGYILDEKNIFNKNRIKTILENYYKIFRQMIPSDYNSIFTFNASTKNKIWFTQKVEEENEINEEKGETNYILNEEIDSNNIYYIISVLKDYNILFDNDLFPYIEDISITLPTLLNYNRNDIYTDIMIKFFKGILLDCNNKEFNNEFKYNIKDIKALNIRLGIFEYWYSQRYECFTKSLENIGIKNKNDYNQLNVETCIECCLIQIYEHIKKKDKNIKILQDEFNDYIKDIPNEDTDKINFIIRFKALCSQCLNSIEEIDNLLNDNEISRYKKEYENDLTIIKDNILMYIARFKFYFYLQNPFIENSYKKFDIVDITNNFHLTQKLLTIINKNYDIEFIPFKEKEELKEIENLNSLLFLYLGNDKLFIKLGEKDFNKRIKILILGFFVKEVMNDGGVPVALQNDKEIISIEDIHKKGIRNIIYITNNNNCEDLNIDESSKNFIQKCDIFTKLFFNFIHNFVSIVVLNDDTTIKKAFTEAKIYFRRNFKNIYEALGIKIDFEKIPKLEIHMKDDNDKFEVEPFENDNFELINKENIKYIHDEYEYEDEDSIKDNVYYKENPFAKGIEIETKPKKTIINKNVIELPGIESFKDFNEFMNGNLYNREKFKELVDSAKNGIENNNIFNLYGTINSQIVDDLCKYYYMEKIFIDGIYIIRKIDSESDFINFIDSIEPKDKNNNKSILVVLDKLNNNNLFLDFFHDALKAMMKTENIIFLICSKEREGQIENGKEFSYTEEKEEKDLNEKYDFIQSYINSTNIYKNSSHILIKN